MDSRLKQLRHEYFGPKLQQLKNRNAKRTREMTRVIFLLLSGSMVHSKTPAQATLDTSAAQRLSIQLRVKFMVIPRRRT